MDEDKKFKPLFQKVSNLGDDATIDFHNSDIDKKAKPLRVAPKTGLKPKTENLTKRHAVYLTPSENQAWLATFKPLEKVNGRLRALILEEISKKK